MIVKYTYYGDADLNGQTDLNDFALFLNGYQNAGTDWLHGDFDYNGQTNLDDFTLFLAGYQNQGAPLTAVQSLIDVAPLSEAERAAMLAAVAAVPEPTGVAMLALGAALAAGSRRTRRLRT